MLLDGKMKKIALLAAVDVCLRSMKISPKRCARNLIELGISAYPDKITGKEQNDLYQNLMTYFENGDIQKAKSLFSSVFL
jgi:DNA-binding protein Fis